MDERNRELSSTSVWGGEENQGQIYQNKDGDEEEGKKKLLCIRMEWALHTDTYTQVEHMYCPNGWKQKRFQQANVPHVQNPSEFNEHFKTAISFELFRVIFASKGSTYFNLAKQNNPQELRI